MPAQLHLIPPPVKALKKKTPAHTSRWPLLVLVAVIAVAVILAIIAERHWPFHSQFRHSGFAAAVRCDGNS